MVKIYPIKVENTISNLFIVVASQYLVVHNYKNKKILVLHVLNGTFFPHSNSKYLPYHELPSHSQEFYTIYILQ